MGLFNEVFSNFIMSSKYFNKALREKSSPTNKYIKCSVSELVTCSPRKFLSRTAVEVCCASPQPARPTSTKLLYYQTHHECPGATAITNHLEKTTVLPQSLHSCECHITFSST